MATELPQPLIEDIAGGKCLPFVGAGFSLNAEADHGHNIPDWRGLAAQLSAAARVDGNPEGPDAAAAYERQFGRVHLIDAVRRSLDPEHIRPGRAHKAFIQLPFDTIYTTNFDLLLEDALQGAEKPYRSLVGELQLPFHAGLFTTNVVKMHGDIGHEEHFVITRADYDKFLETYPVIATHLSAMLIVRTAFFVGYSRTDSDYLQIQSVIRSRLGRYQRMPYLIQFDPDPAEIEAGLDQNIHILPVSTEGEISRSDALAKLFEDILTEVNAAAGKELRLSEPEAFEEVAPATLDLTYRASDAYDLLESSSSLCFVMMPFTRDTEPIYWEVIKPAAEEVGLTPLRADQISTPGTVAEQIRVSIRESRVCIADISAGNANVLYEVGLAQAIGKPVLLMAGHGAEVPFDVAHMRYVAYELDALEEARRAVALGLLQILERNKLHEAETLMGNGMYRAAVAIMGVTLEHALQNALSRTDIHPSRIRSSAMGLARSLYEAHVLDSEMLNEVRQFSEIRNRAVHQLEEPSADDARLAFSLLKHILQSLGEDQP